MEQAEWLAQVEQERAERRRLEAALQASERRCQALVEASKQQALVRADLTELKQAEEVLAETNRRLDLAQTAANAGLWDWNVLTGQIEWSSQMFALFGLDPNQAKASFGAWESALHPDDKELAGQRIAQALGDHKTLDSDYRIVWPNGQIRWINAVGRGQYDSQGEPTRMMGICIDITSRRHAEENYQTLFHEMLDGLTLSELVCDAQGQPVNSRILAVNPAFSRLVGRPTHELLGKLMSEVFPNTKSGWLAAYEKAALKGQPIAFELTSFGALGRVFAVRAFSPQKGQLACLFSDMTAGMEAEQSLRESEAKFSKAFQTSPYAITITRATDGKLLEVNDAFCL